MIEAEIEAGQLLAGKYLVEGVLGRGGMGVVVAAVHQRLNERVAIKVLSRVSEEAIGRFQREARVATRIRSEYVARVMDLGELESGAPYIVMEYLEGEDLAALLRRSGRLRAEEAVDFVLQACVALADAHLLGVVHRDLKPANLFCTRRSDGTRLIKVLDFGVSKLAGDARDDIDQGGTPVTLTAATMGTPLYMSPEQTRSAKMVDARTDIWALGVVLYELLAGEPPFNGESFGHVAIKVASEPVPALSGYRPDLPPGLESVVQRCLEKDREQRFANVAALAHALEPFSSKQGAILVERIASIFRAAAPAGYEQPVLANARAESREVDATRVVRAAATMSPWSAQPVQPLRQNRRKMLVAASVAGILATSVGVLRFLQRDEARLPTQTARSAVPVAPATESVTMQQPLPPVASPPPSAAAEPSPSQAPKRSAPAPAAAHPGMAAPVAPSQAPEPHSSSRPLVSGVRNSGRVQTDPPDCNPRYTIDEQGRKHFKRQCYQHTSQ